ncbi:MAG: Lrp/AsnC family transcriptional regulator [Bacteroidia bacterium]|nr:Lrp/AsnC family transcriptional regulator [Bacteroidia bacterium]
MSDKLDALDYKILQLLQQDCRMTNLEISARIGLSPAPTLERVKKLEKAKIIEGYHAKLNRIKLKLGVCVFIQVSLSRQVDNVVVKFKKRIAELPEIVECYQVTGNSDYLMKIMVTDIPAFEKLISENLSRMDEIGSLHTMLMISELKNSRVLPLKYEY